MKYSEAKPYLKVGMKITLLKSENWKSHVGKTYSLSSLWPGGHINDRTMVGICSPGPLINIDDELEILTESDGVTPWKDPRERGFKVGDRVNTLHGLGRIVGFIEYTPPILVEHDDWLGGHNGHGLGVVTKPDKGWYYNSSDLELLPEEPVKEENPYVYLGNTWDKHNQLELGRMDAIAYSLFVNGFNTTNTYSDSVPLIKPKSFTRKESKMNQVIQSLQAKLKPTDKTLVKHGYLNSDGTRTGMYENELREMAMKKLIEAEDTKEFRDSLAKELKEE